MVRPDLPEAELQSLPTVLTGTIEQATAKIRRLRQLGIDYLSFNRGAGVDWNTLEWLMTAVTQDH